MSKIKRKKKPVPVTPENVLSKGWLPFNSDLSKLSEEQLQETLDLELKGKNRPSYIERIHTRFNTVRVEREKKELAEKVEA